MSTQIVVHESETSRIVVDRQKPIGDSQIAGEEIALVRVWKKPEEYIISGWMLVETPDITDLTEKDLAAAQSQGRDVTGYVRCRVMMPRAIAERLVQLRNEERLRTWEMPQVRIVCGRPLPADGDALVNTVDSLLPGSELAQEILAGFLQSVVPQTLPVETESWIGRDTPPPTIPLQRDSLRFHGEYECWEAIYSSSDEALRPWFSDPIINIIPGKFYFRLRVQIDGNAAVRWEIDPTSCGFNVLHDKYETKGYFAPRTWGSLPSLRLPKQPA